MRGASAHDGVADGASAHEGVRGARAYEGVADGARISDGVRTADGARIIYGEDATGPGVVIGLLGPTAVGKTAVGVELARLLADRSAGLSGAGSTSRCTGRVISCDSMQVYRGFPVLTNQPRAEEVRGVAHALVGLVDPSLEFSAVEYAHVARPLIAEGLASQGWALLVGGTGLYMRAALAPLAVAEGGDPELRARLEARAAAEGPAALHAELARVDPRAADAIDARNIRRVVRALEVVTLSGAAWSGRSDLWAPAYYHPTLVVGLVAQREELYRRIDARAARIVEEGAVEEVRRFRRERGAEGSRPGRGGIRSAIGYPDICRYLDGQQTREETVAQVAAATRRYARRQITWLRKLEDAVIIDAHERSPAEVAAEVLALALSGAHTKGPHHP
ncbi:MAG: tRNA (adenosine(37)-N6)-dimethylallyltransferase MiaA [bacterium]